MKQSSYTVPKKRIKLKFIKLACTGQQTAFSPSEKANKPDLYQGIVPDQRMASSSICAQRTASAAL
jgi:hypothetical protein